MNQHASCLLSSSPGRGLITCVLPAFLLFSGGGIGILGIIFFHEEVREGQYDEMHDEARKQVAVTKQGPLHKNSDKEGAPLPVSLAVPVAKQPIGSLTPFSTILPQNGVLQCGLSDSGGESDGDSKARKTPKKTGAGSSVPQAEKPNKKVAKIELGEGLRRLVFQVVGSQKAYRVQFPWGWCLRGELLYFSTSTSFRGARPIGFCDLSTHATCIVHLAP